MDQNERSRFAADLRRLADLVDSLPVDTPLVVDVNVYCHHVHSLPELQAVMRGVTNVRHETQSKVGPWVKGDFGVLEIAAFYKPGLLGLTRKKKVRIVEVDQEVTVDLSALTP